MQTAWRSSASLQCDVLQEYVPYDSSGENSESAFQLPPTLWISLSFSCKTSSRSKKPIGLIWYGKWDMAGQHDRLKETEGTSRLSNVEAPREVTFQGYRKVTFKMSKNTGFFLFFLSREYRSSPLFSIQSMFTTWCRNVTKICHTIHVCLFLPRRARKGEKVFLLYSIYHLRYFLRWQGNFAYHRLTLCTS